MSDAGRRIRTSNPYSLTLEATIAAKTVIQLPDGRAGISTRSGAIGATVTFETSGVWPLTKKAGVCFLPGTRCFWDHSANEVTFKKVGDRDFYLGVCVGGAASADAEVSVDLNVEQVVDISLLRDGYASVPVGTAAAGAFGYPVRLGGALQFSLTATNEAQKVDALSVDSFAVGANAIVEIIARVTNDGASGSQDISLGVTNGTHATDADSITEALLCHLDGNSTNINFQSRDGTSVAVTNTDSTKDYAEGGEIANRFEIWFDMRNPADVQIYVDGVNVLPASVFDVHQAAGPLKLLVHAEKASGTDVYVLVVDRAIARFSEQ